MVKPELRRTRLMTIRVSPEEWTRITKASNEDDGVRSVSDWLRHAVMEKLGRVAHYDCYYDKGSEGLGKEGDSK